MPTSQRARISYCSGTFVIVLGFVACVCLARRPFEAGAQAIANVQSGTAHGQQLISTYGKLPLSFESNQGQQQQDLQFIAHGAREAILLTSNEVSLELPNFDGSRRPSKSPLPTFVDSLSSLIPSASGSGSSPGSAEARSFDPRVLRITLVGGHRDIQGVGIDRLPGKANYLLGADPQKWKTNIETYSKVRYEEVYPGIDLIYYGNHEQLEDDFVIKPGSDPKFIKLAFEGIESARLDETTGDLLLGTGKGSEDIRLRKPLVYQQQQTTSAGEKNGARQFVNARYAIDAEGRIGFSIAQYDRSKSLIIDPVLSYFTYLGGLLPDFALKIAVDSSGNAYVTGATVSPNFPVSPGALRGTLLMSTCGLEGGHQFPCPDAFVTKLNPMGTAAIYSTYLGGTRSDIGFGIAVDSSGDAYVTGQTESPDFPTTGSGFQRSSVLGLAKAFLTKLDPTGSQILYSTYLGGTSGSVPDFGSVHDAPNDSWATAVAVDNSGNAYIGGYTRSNSFPTTSGVIQPNPGDVTSVTSSFPSKQACPNLGGSSISNSTQWYYRCSDGFVAKLNTTLSGTSSLVYSTYLGGNNYDAVTGIAVDATGNAYVVGATLSSNFPMASAFQSAFAGGQCGANRGGSLSLWNHICADAFVTKLNSTATALIFSTYLGGNADNAATGVAIDSSGNAYVTGFTNSTNFPASTGVAQPLHSAASCFFGTVFLECPDAFVAKFSPPVLDSIPHTSEARAQTSALLSRQTFRAMRISRG